MHTTVKNWIGRTIGGCYTVESRIGSGGQGAVYRGLHGRTGGRVAIKILSERSDNAIKRRFRDEVRAAAQLAQHPGIVKIMDYGQEDGYFFLVMELLNGSDLHSRIEECRQPLSQWQVAQLAQDIGSALHFAHQHSIIHRDIKPQNICFSDRYISGKRQSIAKILDFGVSKAPRTTQITPDNAIIGTPTCMSPEAAQGLIELVDDKSDQWSLAVVLYYALSGRYPFTISNPMATLYAVINLEPTPLYNTEASLSVWNTLHRALSKEKSLRYDSVDDFVADFCQAVWSSEEYGHKNIPSSLRVATPVPSIAQPNRSIGSAYRYYVITGIAASLFGWIVSREISKNASPAIQSTHIEFGSELHPPTASTPSNKTQADNALQRNETHQKTLPMSALELIHSYQKCEATIINHNNQATTGGIAHAQRKSQSPSEVRTTKLSEKKDIQVETRTKTEQAQDVSTRKSSGTIGQRVASNPTWADRQRADHDTFKTKTSVDPTSEADRFWMQLSREPLGTGGGGGRGARQRD